MLKFGVLVSGGGTNLQAILDSLAGERWISPAAARLIGAALSDQAYRDVPVECRDRLRAKLMKQMLTALNM